MNSLELGERTEKAKEILISELGNIGALGIVPGTGWKNGLAQAFNPKLSIPYQHLELPGSDLEVEGHHKDLKLGEIDGRNVIVAGRVHPNENSTDPDLRQAMAIILGALEDCLDGLIITNGVGTLHGPIGRERGLINSLIRTALIDMQGRILRGRPKELINVGDIAIVDDIKTSLVGPFTPLGAGEFEDFYHNGIHRDDDRFFNIARAAVIDIQGHCSRALSRFIAGPQFEGPADKVEFRANGEDIIGMSGIQEVLNCTRLHLPCVQLVLATNGPFVIHKHEDNEEVGIANGEKAGRILGRLADTWPTK
ncbi:hypothetical protein ACFL21_02620 [Patescibacteria group bacterium]